MPNPPHAEPPSPSGAAPGGPGGFGGDPLRLGATLLWSLLPFWVVCFLLFAEVKPLRPVFTEEDGLMESATTTLALGTSLLTLGSWLAGPGPGRRSRVGLCLLLLSGLSLLIFLDELSWGERIFGFEPLVYDGAKRLDSLHDGVGVLRRFTGSEAAFRVVWFGGTAAALAGLWLARGTRPLRWVRVRAAWPPVFFPLVFVAVGWLAVSVDEHAIPRRWFSPALEEMLEFTAVSTLLFTVLAVRSLGVRGAAQPPGQRFA